MSVADEIDKLTIAINAIESAGYTVTVGETGIVIGDRDWDFYPLQTISCSGSGGRRWWSVSDGAGVQPNGEVK